MKTDKIKQKVAAKVAKGKAKVAAKCGKTAKACAAVALLLAFAGCKMGEQPTAQRAQTSIIRDNTFNVSYIMPATPTNAAPCTNSMARAAIHIEVGNQAQANETSGTETMSNTPTSTPQVSTPVQIDARYNDPTRSAADAVGNVAGAVTSASTKDTVNKVVSKIADYVGGDSAAKTETSSTETAATSVKTDASKAPDSLKAAITSYFVDRGGDTSKSKLYYDKEGVLTMTDGTTTVECTADGQCRECGDKD